MCSSKSIYFLSVALTMALPSLAHAQRAKPIEVPKEKKQEEPAASVAEEPEFGFFQKGDVKISVDDFKAKSTDIIDLNIGTSDDGSDSASLVKIGGKNYVIIGNLSEGLKLEHKLIEIPEKSISAANFKAYEETAKAISKELDEKSAELGAQMKKITNDKIRAATAGGKTLTEDEFAKLQADAQNEILKPFTSKLNTAIDDKGNLVFGDDKKLLIESYKAALEDKSAQFTAIPKAPLTEADKAKIAAQEELAKEFSKQLLMAMSSPEKLANVQFVFKGENGKNTTNSFDFVNMKANFGGTNTVDYFKRK